MHPNQNSPAGSGSTHLIDWEAGQSLYRVSAPCVFQVLRNETCGNLSQTKIVGDLSSSRNDDPEIGIAIDKRFIELWPIGHVYSTNVERNIRYIERLWLIRERQ